MGRLQQTSDEEIIRVARECFIQQGPQVATAEIAKRLNISQATLFSRFGSKKTLLLKALGVETEGAWLSIVREGPTDEDVREQLRRIFLAIVQYVKAVMPNLALLRSAGIPPNEVYSDLYDDKEPPNKGQLELANWLERAANKGLVKKCDFKSVSLAMLGGVQSGAFLQEICSIPVEIPSDDQYVESLINLFVLGLKP